MAPYQASLSPLVEGSSEDGASPPLLSLSGASSSSQNQSASELTQSGEPFPSLDTVMHTNVKSLLSNVKNHNANGHGGYQIENISTVHPFDDLVRNSGYRPFDGRDILELLEHDERPIFVLDVKNPCTSNGTLNIAYANRALKKLPDTLNFIKGLLRNEQPVEGAEKVLRWILEVGNHQDTYNTSKDGMVFEKARWTSSTMQRTVKVFRRYELTDRISTPRSQLPSPSWENKRYTPNKDHEKTPTRERSDYFEPMETKSNRHSRSFSSEYRMKEKPAKSPRGSQTPPRRERSSSGSKKPRKIPLAEPRAPDSPPLSAATLEAFRDVYDTSSGEENVFDPCYDWTILSSVSHLSSHIQWIKSIAWENTPVGPMRNWPSDLRQAVNLVMKYPYPAALYWGEELVIFYNEAYIALAGPKHPVLMGSTYEIGWAEIWDLIKPSLYAGLRDNKVIKKDCDPLCINRYGSKFEQCFFDWAIVPVIGLNGKIAGLYNPAFEQTRQVISERQTSTLRAISEHTASVQSPRAFWLGLIKGLETNPYDIPFAVLYSIGHDVDSDSPQSSIYSQDEVSMILTLQGHIGVPEKHSLLAMDHVDLMSNRSSTAKFMRAAIKNQGPFVRSIEDQSLEPEFLKGIGCAIWDGEPCQAVAICPIFVAQRQQPLGFLIAGLNSRRPYNEEYRHYMYQLCRHVETSMASVILVEDEVAKGKKAARKAALEQTRLSEKLQMTADRANENEAQLDTLIDLNPTGLFCAKPDGVLIYCNQIFSELMKATVGDSKIDSWMNVVVEDDRAQLVSEWKQLSNGQKDLDIELCLDVPWTTPSDTIGETWVVVKARAITVEGRVKTILGCIINVSQQKWAEFAEKERKREAIVRKQEQEQFIDMTSHEMRNPLSSILQCAEEITSIVAKLETASDLSKEHQRLVNELSNISNTLSLCGQHEKRIVDDILTLSKQEAGKLKVSSEAADPIALIDVAQTMFKYELKHHDMQLVINVDKSYKDLGVNWVNLDPSRVLAVLVNLTTNSIKFTAKEKFRQITLTLGASLEPAKGFRNVTFVPTQNIYPDCTAEPDWGTGEAVYIHYAVTDTGKGLNPAELNNLFKRFSQATDKTHVAYGGSGLGLFIARLLSELHGGQIGVASEPGKGSTFSFYVKGKRTTKAPLSSIKADLIKPKSQLNVLLVEDNSVVATTAVRSLKSQGCKVLLAEDGIACLEILNKSQWRTGGIDKSSEKLKIDVILMDQQMPRMDGLECTRQIREMTAKGIYNGHVPIIGTTGNARAEQLEVVIAAGMDTIVTKPFTMAELFPKIAELCKTVGGAGHSQ